MTTFTESEQNRVPFFLVEKGQEHPSGYLYFDKDVLVVEFAHVHTPLKIPQSKSEQLIEIIEDASIRVERPDKHTSVQLFFPENGRGRFLIYAIKSWMSGNTDKSTTRKLSFLARFESLGAKCAALWQLVLPYVLLGIAFLLDVMFLPEQQLPEVKMFSSAWKILPLVSIVADHFVPLVAAHYILFAIPGLAILFFSRVWGLQVMFILSVLMTLAVVGIGFFSPQLLENYVAFVPDTIIPAYWFAALPYVLFLMLPAFYYFVVWRRQ